MATLTEILRLYNFEGHPLAPSLNENLYRMALDPRADQDVIKYYFYSHYQGPDQKPAVAGPGMGLLDEPNLGGKPKVFLIRDRKSVV